MGPNQKAWVVYRAGPEGPYAVCEQREWDAMEQAQPGRHMLIRGGILYEAVAEKLAREGTVKVSLRERL
jgi:hypothetical protein